MKFKLKRIHSYLLTGFIFFLFFFIFFLLSFPYGVLKDSVLSKLNSTQNLVNIKAETFAPALPLGMRFDGVRIASKVSPASLRLESFALKVHLLPLFWGQVKGTAILEDAKKNGELRATVAFSLMDLMGSQKPKNISVHADRFNIDAIYQFAISQAVDLKLVDAFVASELQDISVHGDLDGEFFFEPKDLDNAEGQVDLRLVNGKLALSEGKFDIKDQNFSTFHIAGDIRQGNLTLKEVTKIESDGLSLDLAGNVAFAKQLPKSVMDIQMTLDLRGSFAENLGSVFELLLIGRLSNLSAEAPQDLTIKVEFKGPLDNPKKFVN